MFAADKLHPHSLHLSIPANICGSSSFRLRLRELICPCTKSHVSRSTNSSWGFSIRIQSSGETHTLTRSFSFPMMFSAFIKSYLMVFSFRCGVVHFFPPSNLWLHCQNTLSAMTSSNATASSSLNSISRICPIQSPPFPGFSGF